MEIYPVFSYISVLLPFLILFVVRKILQNKGHPSKVEMKGYSKRSELRVFWTGLSNSFAHSNWHKNVFSVIVASVFFEISFFCLYFSHKFVNQKENVWGHQSRYSCLFPSQKRGCSLHIVPLVNFKCNYFILVWCNYFLIICEQEIVFQSVFGCCKNSMSCCWVWGKSLYTYAYNVPVLTMFLFV